MPLCMKPSLLLLCSQKQHEGSLSRIRISAHTVLKHYSLCTPTLPLETGIGSEIVQGWYSVGIPFVRFFPYHSLLATGQSWWWCRQSIAGTAGNRNVTLPNSATVSCFFLFLLHKVDSQLINIDMVYYIYNIFFFLKKRCSASWTLLLFFCDKLFLRNPAISYLFRYNKFSQCMGTMSSERCPVFWEVCDSLPALWLLVGWFLTYMPFK